ncbi:MAG: prepilin-type N-terminal cleavage/methylation domain-containing protein, partial [Verrucomicrobiaceae bacterium]|nr:prepilin-type N-terminal cleavage/methylation domain-containing protein [Verrucomicrobiaceae bacterium]
MRVRTSSNTDHPLRALRRWNRGFSMTELVIVISVIGTLATIAVTSFSHLLSGGKNAIAEDRREMLNHALHSFAQQNYDMVFNRMDSSTADEMVILRTLQYRNTNPNRAKIGSPYVDPRYNPEVGSSTQTHRLRWTGRN